MSETTPPNKSEQFVKFVIDLTQKDNGIAAAFKRADNPATEYQCWEYLARFIDIDKDYERLPYATVASAIAKVKVAQNGTVRIGEAIARCYEEGNNSDQAKAKLRRLLACDSVDEVCRVLRPLFSLIASKAGVQLDYASLLQDLRGFRFDDQQQRIKSRWAQNFYRHHSTAEAGV
ncbi:MAG: type I-E CRISPR-associated protein Cse2/CasB [Methylovulum sp.]|nr:type I-E CRISPR-associated protein Cse2/CasB [Methylovulum sp.]